MRNSNMVTITVSQNYLWKEKQFKVNVLLYK
ncbi:hypothetical protein Bp8pS_210 [Bacillus phage vB_BpuM-BpSp]|nr:hypothetical protein Bp8pS_210 [Bacillus phage vB_BpuM-BpSp]